MLEELRRSVEVEGGESSARSWQWPRLEPLIFPLAIAAATLLGFYVRAVRVFATDFPLNDGGMFYTMTRDLQRNHYLIPSYTSFNHENIPFAYSPFGFYAAGLINSITRLSLVEVFRFLPLLVTTATILAFFRLARTMLASQAAVLAAVVAFALIPRSFIWLLMGGGITRSFGYLFALLALREVYLLYTRGESRFLLPAALYSGLTLLSHLETGRFLAISIAVFFVCYARQWKSVAHSALLAVGAVVVSAPWWLAVMVDLGTQPFRSASQTGVSVFTGKAERTEIWNALKVFGIQTNEPYFWLIGSIALLGVLTTTVSALSASTKRHIVLPVLPLWWLASVVFDNRAAATYMSAAVALLTGIAIAEVILPALNRAFVSSSPTWQEEHPLKDVREIHPSLRSVLRQWPVLLALGALLAYSTLGVLTTRSNVSGDLPTLVSLTKDERAAMIWMRDHTPPQSDVLVITGVSAWPNDRVVEWLPALAERRSVDTPQGQEWVPDKEFLGRIFRHGQAQACAWQDSYCLDRWTLATGAPFNYVYVRTTRTGDDRCCGIADYLLTDSRYELVFHNGDAAIYEKIA